MSFGGSIMPFPFWTPFPIVLEPTFKETNFRPYEKCVSLEDKKKIKVFCFKEVNRKSQKFLSL